MSIKETIAASALAALALSACQGGPRVVENPLIEAANSLTLDITKVELTDERLDKNHFGRLPAS